jgi:hypothetical protein
MSPRLTAHASAIIALLAFVDARWPEFTFGLMTPARMRSIGCWLGRQPVVSIL